MQEFLSLVFTLPTVLFTVPLALSLLYWALVVLGAADVDLLGGADGVVEGAGEAASEAAAEGLADAAGEGGAAELLSALKLRSAPVTVVVSIFSLSGWLLCFFGSSWLAYFVGDALPRWAQGSLGFAAAFLGALFVTSLLVRPLAPIFEHTSKRGGRHLIGKTCVIRTGRVDARFGQAEMADGGAGLLLHVRCADDDNGLHKGAEALIIDYDQPRDVYLVEPLQRLLSGAKSSSPPSSTSSASEPANDP